MPRAKKVLATDLSLAELKQLVAMKEQSAALEERKAELEQELAQVEAALRRVLAGGKAAVGASRRGGRKKAGRRAAAAPAKPRHRGAKAVAKKAGRRAAKVGKKTKRAAAGRRVKTAPRRRAGAGKPTLQEVVAGLIRQNGGPLAFQDILGTIQKQRLVATKSGNFANVLRRTLSTSKLVKRVARGTYGLAQ